MLALKGFMCVYCDVINLRRDKLLDVKIENEHFVINVPEFSDAW